MCWLAIALTMQVKGVSGEFGIDVGSGGLLVTMHRCSRHVLCCMHQGMHGQTQH